jgi:hypothetical protein
MSIVKSPLGDYHRDHHVLLQAEDRLWDSHLLRSFYVSSPLDSRDERM